MEREWACPRMYADVQALHRGGVRLPFVSLPLEAPSADMASRLVYYLVDTPEGSVGVLDGLKRDEDGRAATLIVAQGWFGRRQLSVPIEQLVEVDHVRKRIILASGAAPIEHKGLRQRLLNIGERGRPADG